VESGRASVTDEDHSGCLTTSQMMDNVEWVNALVQEDGWTTVTNIAGKLDSRCGFAYSIIHKDLRYQNSCKEGTKAAYR